MANLLKLKVTKVSDKTKNGNFIHTVKTEGAKSSFMGVEKTSGAMYLIALKQAIPLGTEQEVDMDQFAIVPQTSQLEDKNTGEVRTATFNWLQNK